MSHVKNWKKTLIAILAASAAQMALADDPVPAFMQYNTGGNTPHASASPSPQPTAAPVAKPEAKLPAISEEPKQAVAPVEKTENKPVPAPISVAPKNPLPVVGGAVQKPVAQGPVDAVPVVTGQQMVSSAPLPGGLPMDGRYHPQKPISPDTLSERERINQLQKSEADSNAALWQARAKQAEAQAAYEAAMKKITDAQVPPPPPVDPKASAAIAQLNVMAARQGFDGIKIMSTYGETHGRMYADVTLNGTPMTVAKGDKLGDWRVVKIETTYVKVSKKGEQKDLFIHTNQE